jgi:Fungal specific transcription factor domain
VKCDETKPACLRCQKFGRICDGYAPEPSQHRGVIQIQPRVPRRWEGPSLNIHTSEDESRYFEFFSERTAHELSGFFDSEFWSRLVLQESHNVAAIRHAVIALGALNKSLESAPGPDLKVNVIQSIDKKHHENAVAQHLKAIQALNYYISSSDSPQLRNALIACLLFVCFETFQGSYASSVQQTYGGLKILRSYYVGKPGSRPWIPQHSTAPPNPVHKSVTISRELQARLGCDNVSKEIAIAMHLEEYLETDQTVHLDTAEDPGSEIRESPVYRKESPIRDPQVEHVDIPSHQIGGTDSMRDRQRSVNMYPSNTQTKAYLQDTPFSTEVTTPSTSDATRKASIVTLSSSTVSTPATYTPPSTGPHTPSPSNPAFTRPSSSSRKRSLVSRSASPVPILQNDLTIEEILIQSFVRLDGQGLFFGMTPGIPPLYWDIYKVWHLTIPPSFSDFHSAQRCWDFLMDRILQFYRRTTFNRAYAPASADTPASLSKQHTMYRNHLDAFETAFKPLLDSAILPNGTITNAAALVLSLYQKLVSIILATVTENSEMVYDAFLSDFRYITRTCARIIACQDSTQLPRNPRFSFDIGIIPPLHVTATKCRDPVVRREAIDLMFNSPRQEGMWDGVLSARIGRWIVTCEEEGLTPPTLLPDKSQWFGASHHSYPSPPHIVEEIVGGGWGNGKQNLNGGSEIGGRRPHELGNRGGMRADPTGNAGSNEMGGNGKENGTNEWIVPEKNRVQLMVVDFHIPDRYIKVKCQRSLVGKDGRKEERETVIAW